MQRRRGRVMVTAAGAAVVAAGLLTTASCTRVECVEFASSSSGDGSGGQPTPLEAAESYATQADTGSFPDAGWREDGRDETGVIFRSGDAMLRAVQGGDGTWTVDYGTSC
jgi:hypothetical protein